MSGPGSPFVVAFHQLLARAAGWGASDVHVEPHGEELVVRMRIDGRLRVVQRLQDREFRRRWLEVIKRECGLDTGMLGQPQDARFSLDDPACDFRVALVPGSGGLESEKIVLRLLPRSARFDLGSYPMPEACKADLRRALGKRDGLVIVSGPTGSGKTTLLYNALAALDPVEHTIYTLEDPVEYRLPGLWQCQVDRRAGVGFAELLRAMMRADPDVLLVGEIRDGETAAAAFHAAKTGHLVLSTVHANTAAEVADRLEDLGISRFTYTTSVRFVSAQRLVPRICEGCRIPDPTGRDLLVEALGSVEHAFTGAGCDACDGIGTRGRVLLMGWEAQDIEAERAGAGNRDTCPDFSGRGALAPRLTLREAARRAAQEGVVRAVDAAGY